MNEMETGVDWTIPLFIGLMICSNAIFILLYVKEKKANRTLNRKLDKCRREKRENMPKIITNHGYKRPAQPTQRAETPQKRKIPESEMIEDQPSTPIDMGTSPVIPEKESIEPNQYFAGPAGENKFYLPDGTKIPEQDTLFEFDGNTFYFYQNSRADTWRMALNYEETYIRTVCEVINAKEAHHYKLTTVEPGECKLENEELIVIKKMKTSYA